MCKVRLTFLFALFIQVIARVTVNHRSVLKETLYLKSLKMGLFLKITPAVMEILLESPTSYIFLVRSNIGLSKNVTTRLMPCPGGKMDVTKLGVSNIARKIKILCIFKAFKSESCNVVHIMTGLLCMTV